MTWPDAYVATALAAPAALAQQLGPLNSPVRSQDPAKFNSKEVLAHLAPVIWEGDNLA
ncbi:hypothetical protein D3C84_1091690 [compost metagenome]